MPLILVDGLGLFLGSMALHIVVWRSVRVRAHGPWLVGLLFCLPFAAVVAIGFSSGAGEGISAGEYWLGWGLSYLMHAAMSASYMIFYTGLVGFSPSIAILDKVDANMPRGLRRDELCPDWFNDDRLSGARRRNLLAGRLASESGGVIRLEPVGLFIAQGVLVYRRLLGLPPLAKG